MDEIHACTRMYLDGLQLSWGPQGIWRFIVRFLAGQRVEQLFARLRAYEKQSGEKMSEDGVIEPNDRQTITQAPVCAAHQPPYELAGLQRQNAEVGADRPARIDGAGSILLGIFAALESANIPYCVSHGYDGYPERVKSDVDIIVSANIGPRQLLALLQENRARMGAEVVRHRGRYFILAGRNSDSTPCFLELDLETNYVLGDRHFLSGNEILESRQRHGQFWVPAPSVEFCCYLIRRIAKGRLDDDQGRKLSSLYAQDPDVCRLQVARFWSANSADFIVGAVSSGKWEALRRSIGPLGSELRRRALMRHPWLAVVSWVRRMTRRAKVGCWPDSGLDIVFLGPDGAGKSSVVKAVRQQLAGAFARTTSESFPPAFLRRLLQRPEGPQNLPHAEAPRSALASVVRAVGYWFPYATLGHLFTVHVALAQASLVLHDRHIVDVLVDPRRYRYTGPSWLLRFIWRLVPKPDLVFLLDAPAEVLQARKQEVPFEETARQREAYLSLLQTLANGHVISAARPLDQVVGEVSSVILKHLAARARRPLGLEQGGLPADQPVLCSAVPAEAVDEMLGHNRRR